MSTPPLPAACPRLPRRGQAAFRRPRRTSTRASALVMVMLIMTVLSVVAASLLLTTTMRYHTTFQSASWQEAVVGAEAGVDLAMSELRKRVVQGPDAAFLTGDSKPVAGPWTATAPGGAAFANYGHAFPGNGQPALVGTHGGEGSTALQTRVFVDVPGSGSAPTYATQNFAVPPPDAGSAFLSQPDNPGQRDADGVDRSRWWYRIRALGIAGLAGPPVANLQKMDNRLRRFSFFTDWRTGQAVAAPQTARLVEAIVRPQTNFRNALMADKQINLNSQDVLIDSYDSSKGGYSSATNHGQMGNLATNGQLINAGKAKVNGDAMTNNGTINDAQNVTGQQSSSFYQELTPITNGTLNPAWSSVPDGGTVTADATYKASGDLTNPTLVRLDGINLAAGGSAINVTAPDGAVAGTPSYIKVYVQGDITTAGLSCINLGVGVNAMIYFTGNVNLQGSGIFNNSMLASHLVLNGLQPPANADGTYPARAINVATTQDFEGIVYAPNHDVSLTLQAVPSGTAGSPRDQSAADQLNKLQDDQNKAEDEFNKDYAAYQHDMAAVGNPVGPLTVVPATYASDLSTMLSTPNGQTRSDVAKLQAALNKVSQTQIQIESVKGTLTPSQQDDHARGYNGIYGGFVGRTISVANKTHVHYDETLRQAGPVNHYEITNWFEDNLSRDATGGTKLFWW